MKFYGQYKQDEYVYTKFFQGKKDGFFVDIGAHDGISLNNTYALELIGWKGICIEPTPYIFEELVENRKCEVVKIALCNKKGEMDFLVLRGYTQMLSGLMDNYDPRHLQRIQGELTIVHEGKKGTKELIKSQTDTFMSLNTPNIIDFVSLDVEGSELKILEGIDFNLKKIKVMAIENNYHDPNINKILFNNGFTIDRYMDCDTIFVNPKNLSL